MSKRYVGPGRVRLCLAWRIDAPDGSVHFRETRAQAREILQRIRDALSFMSERRKEAIRAAQAPRTSDKVTRRMLGMAPATDAEALEAEADGDGNE